jgi:carbamoyltransferase
MKEAIIGISAFYHDSAAAIVVDGEIIAAAQEERFSRIRHDSSFPCHAVRYVLNESGFPIEKISAIAFYEKPLIRFERLIETCHAFAPMGVRNFAAAIPVWLREKLFLKKILKDEIAKIGETNARFLFPEHHLSHAASAFYPSPFHEAAIVTLDGVGEWATATIGKGSGNEIEVMKELHFPHSLGLLYSAFTYYLGFRVNSGEYKLMGLAPYGNANASQTKNFRQIIENVLADIKADGSLFLNMDYFKYATGLVMTDNRKWEQIFGFPPRNPEQEITQEHMNLALAIQQVTEDIILKIAIHARYLTGCLNLTMAGGVALNCVANGKLTNSGIFENIWIQPASGDAGGAVGAALATWHIYKGMPRHPILPDAMKGSLLGPEFSADEIARIINKYDAVSVLYPDTNKLCHEVASLLAAGKVVGWFQGRLEFGPRALGNRSILGDPRDPEMQKKLNLKIKYREGFRPFAPAVIEGDSGLYFESWKSSPYMLLTSRVKASGRNIEPADYSNWPLTKRLYHQRSDIPAVTHVDYSARVQSVGPSVNPLFYKLLEEFRTLTGLGMLVNTSFNVRGEPLVCNPDDAFRCFMSTEMDFLVLGNCLLDKSDQPKETVWVKGPKSYD